MLLCTWVWPVQRAFREMTFCVSAPFLSVCTGLGVSHLPCCYSVSAHMQCGELQPQGLTPSIGMTRVQGGQL